MYCMNQSRGCMDLHIQPTLQLEGCDVTCVAQMRGGSMIKLKEGGGGRLGGQLHTAGVH